MPTVARVLYPPNPPGTPPAAFFRGRPIDGIPCSNETLTYHVHAHLAILDRGKQIPVSAGIGINYKRGCLYWLHTHDDSGIIHLEAPHVFHPSLRQFFDIWGETLSRKRVASIPVQSGRAMLVFVDGKIYSGNPGAIQLGAHTLVTFEIGGPFVTPGPYDFGSN